MVVFDGVAASSAVRDQLAPRGQYGVPRVCYVNKMDRSGASFTRCVE